MNRWRGLIALGALSASCGTAQNYLDPGAPFYEGHRGDASAEPAAPPSDAPLRGADVLALQEMDAPGTERLAGELGMNYIYFPGGVHPSSGRDFGCAILSPWPIRNPRKIILPGHSKATGLRRAAVVGTIQRGSQAVRVYAVHLPAPHGMSGANRHDQAQALIADAAGSTDPVIVVGDFNSHGIGKDFVAAGFTWPTKDLKGTERMMGLSFSYDHVFAKALAAVPGLPAAGVVRENRGASDHHPVWVLLTTPGKGMP